MRRYLRLSCFAVVFLCPLALPARAEVTMDQVREEIQKQIHAVPKPANNPSVFNPAMGLVLDAVASRTTAKESNFDFRSAEISLQSAIDPFANLFAVINGTPDGVEVEEPELLPELAVVAGLGLFERCASSSFCEANAVP
jgi:hypothetical protein